MSVKFPLTSVNILSQTKQQVLSALHAAHRFGFLAATLDQLPSRHSTAPSWLRGAEDATPLWEEALSKNGPTHCLCAPTGIFSPLHPKLNTRDTENTNNTIKTTERIRLYKLIKVQKKYYSKTAKVKKQEMLGLSIVIDPYLSHWKGYFLKANGQLVPLIHGDASR